MAEEKRSREYREYEVSIILENYKASGSPDADRVGIHVESAIAHAQSCNPVASGASLENALHFAVGPGRDTLVKQTVAVLFGVLQKSCGCHTHVSS